MKRLTHIKWVSVPYLNLGVLNFIYFQNENLGHILSTLHGKTKGLWESGREQGELYMDFGTNLLVAWLDWDSLRGILLGTPASYRRQAGQHRHSWNTHPLAPLWFPLGSCASPVASSWISLIFLPWQWVDSRGQILSSQHSVDTLVVWSWPG